MQRIVAKYNFSKSKPNPFQRIAETFTVGDTKATYYNIPALKDDRYEKLPYGIRVLLESAIRNCDEF